MRIPKHKPGDIVKSDKEMFEVIEVYTSSYKLKHLDGRFVGRITKRTCMLMDK